MATTRLYVEILVIGSIALLWVIAVVFALVAPTIGELTSVIKLIAPLVPLLVAPVLAFTYGLGWIISFVSEHVFKELFQEKYRDGLFKNEGLCYYDIKSAVLQRASEKSLEDRQIDRHIIRISRSNVFNFFLLAITMLPYGFIDIYLSVACVMLFWLLATGSFYQWRARYMSHYKSMLSKYREISKL